MTLRFAHPIPDVINIAGTRLFSLNGRLQSNVMLVIQMIYYVVKVVVSAVLIVLISEIAKRSSLAGAVVASLPIVSILAFIWLYLDTGDAQKVAALSKQIVWLVIPSLVMFVTLPVFLKNNMNFYLGLSLSTVLTAGAYFVLVWILRSRNINI